MPTVNLGRVAIKPRGEWSASVADYKYLETVKYNGAGYMINIATGTVPAGTLPTNTAYFDKIVDKGDKGDKGDTGASGTGKIPTWIAQSYPINSQVLNLGRSWTSNAATVAADIPGTSVKWVEDLTGYNTFSKERVVNSEGIATEGVYWREQVDKSVYPFEGVISIDTGGFTPLGLRRATDYVPLAGYTHVYQMGGSYSSAGTAFYTSNTLESFMPGTGKLNVGIAQLIEIPKGANFARNSDSGSGFFQLVNAVVLKKGDLGVVKNGAFTVFETSKLPSISVLLDEFLKTTYYIKSSVVQVLPVSIDNSGNLNVQQGDVEKTLKIDLLGMKSVQVTLNRMDNFSNGVDGEYTHSYYSWRDVNNNHLTRRLLTTSKTLGTAINIPTIPANARYLYLTVERAATAVRKIYSTEISVRSDIGEVLFNVPKEKSTGRTPKAIVSTEIYSIHRGGVGNIRNDAASILRLTDHSLIVAWNNFGALSGDANGSVFKIKKSIDNSKTWSSFSEIKPYPNIYNPSFYYVGTTIYCMFLVKTASHVSNMAIVTSSDQALTWSAPITISDTVTGQYWVNGPHKVIKSKDGTKWLYPIAQVVDLVDGTSSSMKANARVLTSSNGLDWTLMPGQPASNIDFHSELSLTYDINGALVLHGRTRIGYISESKSIDNGVAWSDWTRKIPATNAMPHFIKIPNKNFWMGVVPDYDDINNLILYTSENGIDYVKGDFIFLSTGGIRGYEPILYYDEDLGGVICVYAHQRASGASYEMVSRMISLR